MHIHTGGRSFSGNSESNRGQISRKLDLYGQTKLAGHTDNQVHGLIELPIDFTKALFGKLSNRGGDVILFWIACYRWLLQLEGKK